MRRRLLFLLILIVTHQLHAAEDAAAILARVDTFRNPAVEPSRSTSISPASRPTAGTSRRSSASTARGATSSVVEFVAPATEKGKFLLMLRDAMWIYMPSARRPIRISPLQRLMGQASNGDVARTNFTVDYNAVGIAEEGDAWVLDLAAKDPVRRVQPRAAVGRQEDE